MQNFKIIPVTTGYWRPGHPFLEEVCRIVGPLLDDQDIVVFSEKALSTALGHIVDESAVRPGLLAKILAVGWMRIIWGFLLGRLCRMKPRTVGRLRKYPYPGGSRHKQVALDHAGLLAALRHGSEGGIDGSNLPFSYVSLLLPNPSLAARRIAWEILRRTGRRVGVIIMDSDKMYRLGPLYLGVRDSCLHLLNLGFISYVIGRALKLRRWPTPVAAYNVSMEPEKMLDVLAECERVMGHGAGPTVWDMAEKFKVDVDKVTWEMLESIEHRPLAIVKTKHRQASQGQSRIQP